MAYADVLDGLSARFANDVSRDKFLALEQGAIALRERDALSASLAAAEERAAKAEQERAAEWTARREAEDNGLTAYACVTSLRTERDDLAMTVAGLRGALLELREEVSAGCHPDAPVEELKEGIHFEAVLRADAALAASPAEHAARLKAAALRSMGNYLSHVSREVKEDDHHEYDLWPGLAAAAQHCHSEADRLEKAVVK